MKEKLGKFQTNIRKIIISKYFLLPLILFLILINVFPVKKSFPDAEQKNLLSFKEGELYSKDCYKAYTKERLLDSGELVTINTCDYYGYSNHFSYIRKYDTDFHWEYHYNQDTLVQYLDYNIYFYDIIQDENNGYIAVGKAKNNKEDHYGHLILVNLNSNFEINNVIFLNDYNYVFNYQQMDIILSDLGDGNFSLLFNSLHLSDNRLNNKLDIIQFTTQIWDNNNFTTHSIELVNQEKEIRLINNIDYDNEGNMYISGSFYKLEGTSISLNENQSFLMKLSASNDVVWNKIYNQYYSKLLITDNDQLILVGFDTKPAINLKEGKFFSTKNIDEVEKEITMGITVNLNKNDGTTNWIKYFKISPNPIKNISIAEDEEGFLYVLTSNYNIIKYNKNGTRIGEISLSNTIIDENYTLYIKNNTIYVIFSKGYKIVSPSESDWVKDDILDYNQVKFYHDFLTIRVWINRIVFYPIIGYIGFILLKKIFIFLSNEHDFVG